MAEISGVNCENGQEKTGYPSIDRPWLKYYTEQDLKNVAPKMTVCENIYTHNCKYPSDVALLYYGNKITYRTLFAQIERAKKAFLQLGVREGDNVAFLMLSCPEMLYAILALNSIGVCANMINPTFTTEQMRDRINDTEADVFVVLDQLYERIAPAMDEIVPKKRIIVPIESSMPAYVKLLVHGKLKKNIRADVNTQMWDDFVKSGNSCSITSDYTYKEGMPAIMVYSSGTTGASKGIVLTNDGINGTIAHYDKEEFVFNRGDRFLHMGAPWLSTLMVVCMLMPLQKGIMVVIEPVFSEETFFKGIKKYKPTFTLSTISHWLYVMNHKDAGKIDFRNMRYPITGGEKILKETEEEINAYLKRQGCPSQLLAGYGMCELGSTAVAASFEHIKIGSPGYPITDVIVTAFDKDTDKEMQYGQRGEIRVCTPNRMKEYYKRPDATAEFFWTDDEGRVWGCTGDVGYVDEDGFVYVEGRVNDCFVSRSGEKIYCFDIEDVILKAEGVSQCEVVGVTQGGYDVPVAFVTAVSEKIDIDTIMNLCKEKLSEDSIPVRIEVLDKFPVKSSGKRDMETLKKMAEKIFA